MANYYKPRIACFVQQALLDLAHGRAINTTNLTRAIVTAELAFTLGTAQYRTQPLNSTLAMARQLIGKYGPLVQ